MFSASIVIFLLFLVLPGLKIKKVSYVLTKEETMSIKGLLCIMVYFNHFSGWFLELDPILYFLVHCGSFMVSDFFFLSAYGLTKSQNFQNETVKGLLMRILKLFIPFWISDLLYLVIHYSMNVQLNVEVNASTVLLSVLNLAEIVHNSWFVSAIVFLYIAFFFVKKSKRINQTLLFCAILACACLIVPDVWKTFFAFPLGLLIVKKENLFIQLKKLKYIMLLLGSVSGVIVSIIFKYVGETHAELIFLNKISDILSGCFFAIFVYLVATRIHIGNKILLFLGKISYEFYLVHGLGIFFANKFFDITRPFPFMILSLLFSFIASFLINKLVNLIFSLFKKKSILIVK